MKRALNGENLPIIRLGVFDIDGTLVRRDKSLTGSTVAAFGRLREAGVVATLISARPPTGMTALGKTLGITVAMAAFNGGTIIAANGVCISSVRIEASATRTALASGHICGVDTWVFADGHWYATNTDSVRIAREVLSSGLEPILIRDFSEVKAEVDKIVFVSENPLQLQQLEADLRTALGTRTTIAASQPYLLDVTAPTANKGDGVAALARLIGVGLGNVAVVGDMTNDLPMFARTGLSIAMGQAPDNVIAAADYVTDTDEDDGAANAIDRIILPRVGRRE